MEDAAEDESLRIVASLLIVYAIAQIGAKVVELPVRSGIESNHNVGGRKVGCNKRETVEGKDPLKSIIDVKVLILGAGASGLWAAKSFLQKGFDDFLVLEGASYAGGRVHDVDFANVRVEAGANWVVPGASQISKDVVAMVQRKCLKYHVSNSNSMVAKESHQQPVSEEHLSKRRGTLLEVMHKVQELGHELIDQCRRDISQRLALTMNGWHPGDALDKALEWFMYDFEWQDPPHAVSLKSTARIDNTDASWFITDQRGFKSIFDDVINFLVNSRRLILNKCVAIIDQSGDEKVYVTCADGSVYRADYILTTFSLGVLQHKLVTFEPPLPEWKVETIDNFRMGLFTKVFVKFPRKFWGDEEWILHVSDRRGFYPTFLNLEANGLFPAGTNILVGFLVGEEALRVERQPLEDTKAEIDSVMKKLFASDFTQSSNDNDIPMPSDIYVTDWSKNPLHMGSFSNWPVDFTREMSQQMQANVDRVFFGGEATDDMYNGYIIGAIRSGQRECEKIMRLLMKTKSSHAMKRSPADYVKY